MIIKQYLAESYRAIFHSVGAILLIAALIMLLPLLLIPFFPGEMRHAASFIGPAVALAATGFLMRMGAGRNRTLSLSVNEGGVIVVLGWGLVMLFSALPIMLIGDLPFSRALFESVSGWTTTGLSVLNVEKASSILLLWRSIIQLFGGAGLAIIMISAVSGHMSGIGISSAEGRGEQLAPHVKKSARLVFSMYLIYAGVGILAYILSGMSIFDAVNHSFAAVSTGGFSTRSQSIGYWDSVYVEAVSLPLMILGNLSFITAWMLWRGQLRKVWKNGEIRLMAVLIPAAAITVFLLVSLSIYPTVGKSIRVAVFETVSALTTTGFSTVGYSDWNPVGITILTALMVIGGGTYSTAGGIKQYRIYMIYRHVVWEIKSYVMPKSWIQVRSTNEGGTRTEADMKKMYQIFAFTALYLFLFFAGVVIHCGLGYSLSDSMFENASSIGTVGLSIGITSADMPDAALYVSMAGMFLGRLEITIVIIAFIKMANDLYTRIRSA